MKKLLLLAAVLFLCACLQQRRPQIISGYNSKTVALIQLKSPKHLVITFTDSSTLVVKSLESRLRINPRERKRTNKTNVEIQYNPATETLEMQ